MHIRIVRPKIQADRVEEAAKHWQSIIAPRIKNNPMLAGGYMAANADRSQVIAVTIWNQLPDPETSQKVREEIFSQMRDYAEGPMPPMDEYEVLAQI